MSLRNPVKYPVKYYSWQDAQAPQLSNADGVIKTILKACLVTGYGTKTGAGWTTLFEDDYRIVLRRPLRIGNPPDVKIENGAITETTIRHRIVAQDNPAGVDDVNELSSINLLAKLATGVGEWHLLATDFAFMFCYQNGGRNSIYCGEVMRADSMAQTFIFTSDVRISIQGQYTSYANSWLLETGRHVNMLNKTIYNINILSLNFAERAIDNDYMAQKIIIGDMAGVYPFYTALSSFSPEDMLTKVISMDGRQFLRYVNARANNDYQAILYAPLDYWEL